MMSVLFYTEIVGANDLQTWSRIEIAEKGQKYNATIDQIDFVGQVLCISLRFCALLLVFYVDSSLNSPCVRCCSRPKSPQESRVRLAFVMLSCIQ